MKTIKLSNGVEMPQIGYGVYQVRPDECERCVRDALEVGYRLIDTARNYGNEEGVGKAVKNGPLSRDEVFIVDKIWISDFGYEKAKAAIDDSLRKIQSDYIDLMLLHEPFCDRYGAYRAVEEAYKAGKFRAIGVSNFYPDHLIDLAYNVEIPPMINQVETHVFQQQAELSACMKELGIAHMAWGPLAQGKHNFFQNELLASIGKKYGKSVSQVALRYFLQKGIVIIPKTTHKERMQENLAIEDFNLSDEDMAQILAMDRNDSLDFHSIEAVKMFMGWR